MMILKNKQIDCIKRPNYLFVCIITAFIISVLSLGWVIIADNGIFTIRDDFNVQQIPFAFLARNTLEHGFDGWCWNLDLGTSLIQGLSFYNLGSPFFWITFLFPKNAFPYIVGVLYIAKYIVASVTSYLYIGLFTNDKKYAVLGAILYAFSGFQTSNLLFYHFHDVVAFFPLLLYSTEKTVQDKKNRSLMIISVFISALINYYFFVQQFVFLVLYFVFRFLKRNIKDFLIKTVRCIYCGAIGVGMAAILFLPNVMYILNSTRASGVHSLSEILVSSQYFWFILKGLILPGEAMNDHTSLVVCEWSSTAAYLPLIGLSLVFAYIFTKKDWLSRIIKVLLVCSFVPILSSAFLMFSESTRRWWFVMIMMMALASALVLENFKEYATTKGIILNGGLVVLFYLAVSKFPMYSSDLQLSVFHDVRLVAYVLLTLTGLLIVYLIFKIKKRYYYISALVAISVFAVGTTSATTYFYRRNTISADDYLESLSLGTKLETLDDQYRFNISDNIFAMTGSAAGLSSFCSTVSYSICDFDSLFDYYEYVIRMNKNTVEGLPQLLGARYSVKSELNNGEYIVDEIKTKNNVYYIVENPACPIGFRVDSYIYREELKKLEIGKRGIALLDAAVLDTWDEYKMPDYIERIDAEDIDFEKTVEQYVSEKIMNAVLDFSRDTKGFSCKSDYGEPSLIYFTVPFDEGWTVYVDGEDTTSKIINSGGMVLLPVDAGMHIIEFVYTTPGFNEGIIISVMASIIFVGILAYDFVKNKKIKHFT